MSNYGVEGSIKGSRVKADVRLVLDKVELMMMQFVSEQLIPELQGCLNAACEDVLKVEKWKPHPPRFGEAGFWDGEGCPEGDDYEKIVRI